MSGIIGHTMYAILAAKAAAGRRLPIAPAYALSGTLLTCVGVHDICALRPK